MSNQTISAAAREAAELEIQQNLDVSFGKGRGKFVQQLLDAAARVEPTDKDLWTVRPIYEGQNIVTANLFIAGINYQFDGRYFDTIRELAIAHNASLPATPTPQGQTSEEIGPPNCVLCGKPPHTDSCGHSYLPPEEIYAERETKSSASLGAATDKEGRFS